MKSVTDFSTEASTAWQTLRALEVSLGLPISTVEFRRTGQDAVRVTAIVHISANAATHLQALYAFAALANGTTETARPYRCSVQPSGMQRSVRLAYTAHGLAVEIVALLDAAIYATAEGQRLLALALDEPEAVLAAEVVQPVGGRVSHMMQFTGSGRDTGHAVCGAANGSITLDDAKVSCPECLEGADEQYDDARQVVTPIEATYSDPAVRAAISGGAQ